MVKYGLVLLVCTVIGCTAIIPDGNNDPVIDSMAVDIIGDVDSLVGQLDTNAVLEIDIDSLWKSIDEEIIIGIDSL